MLMVGLSSLSSKNTYYFRGGGLTLGLTLAKGQLVKIVFQLSKKLRPTYVILTDQRARGKWLSRDFL